MKKIAKIVSVLHMIAWVINLLLLVVKTFTYSGTPEMEPLEIAFTIWGYIDLTIIAFIGCINAAILFFSLRAVLRDPGVKHKKTKKVAFCFSIIATVLVYSAVIMLSINKPDSFLFYKSYVILALPPAWLLCELCCGIMFAVSKAKKAV